MLSRLKWLTFLSLDAPLVAVAWQALIAKESGYQNSWYHTLIVFMSVWLGYAADRWFDNFKSRRPSSEQHQFYAKHSSKVFVAWIIVLGASITLSFTYLDSHELRNGFVLMALAISYTLFAQKARKLKYYSLLKPLFTALLILGSAVLFIPLSERSWIPLLCIWLLFTSNCLYIRSWTHSSEPSAQLQATLFTVAVSCMAVITIWTHSFGIGAAAILAQVAIVIIHRARRKIDTPTLRTTADLCLLTPALFLFL